MTRSVWHIAWSNRLHQPFIISFLPRVSRSLKLKSQRKAKRVIYWTKVITGPLMWGRFQGWKQIGVNVAFTFTFKRERRLTAVSIKSINENLTPCPCSHRPWPTLARLQTGVWNLEMPLFLWEDLSGDEKWMCRWQGETSCHLLCLSCRDQCLLRKRRQTWRESKI